MRLATLGINLGLALASFALGLGLGRSPLLLSDAAERELVSGAAAREPVAATDAALPRAELAGAAVGAAGNGKQEARPAKAKSVVEAEPTWQQVAARAQRWTASVRADQNYGAGLIVDRSGLILTNLHVVSEARAITVTAFGAAPAPARLLDSDVELDLALLRATLPSPLGSAATLAGATAEVEKSGASQPGDAKPGVVGAATALSVGDEVLAVGSPRKMYYSVSRGMVSFPNRLLDGVEYIQTDLPINEGNSGGPLVDRTGRVVGIVSFILKESQGLSFALPIERAVARFATQLAAPPKAKSERAPRGPAAGGPAAGEPPRITAH